MSGGALDLDLSEPVGTLTLEAWKRAQEEVPPVHFVLSERRGSEQ